MSGRACAAGLTRFFLTCGLVVGTSACADRTAGGEEIPALPAAMLDGDEDYCALPEFGLEVLADRPGPHVPAIDDVNWFARPVPHQGDDWIIGFASHDQNYIYNLTTDQRVRIPDRSDAVATPDGRYMTVPSYYTPDSNTRFYPVAPMLDALNEGRDVADLEPSYIHDHPAMKRVYYQSTAVVSGAMGEDGSETTYRLMFSGTGDESRFRIVDYRFRFDGDSGELLEVEPSEPMTVCPVVQNDLNTPFISKDGRHVAAYTSEVAGNSFSAGASLKIFEITALDPAAGTTRCTEVADLGFVAGKADFSFDGSMIAFHLSQGDYLTPFVNGGLPASTITDVVVARLDRTPDGRITGSSGLQRLTTSSRAGVGSYFPAFLPDGNLFFISNTTPRDSDAEKRFRFRVVDPAGRAWRTRTMVSGRDATLWRELGALWQNACVTNSAGDPFPLDPHELPAQAMALTPAQCSALVRDSRADATATGEHWERLLEVCTALQP